MDQSNHLKVEHLTWVYQFKDCLINGFHDICDTVSIPFWSLIWSEVLMWTGSRACLSARVSDSCLATMATRSPESFFFLILFFPSPSCAVMLSHFYSQSLSLCLSVLVDAHMLPPSVSHTLAVCHISSHRLALLVPFEVIGCSWHKIAVSLAAELYEHFFPSKETTYSWKIWKPFRKYIIFNLNVLNVLSFL